MDGDPDGPADEESAANHAGHDETPGDGSDEEDPTEHKRTNRRDLRDPVEEAAAGQHDLYDVATWEERTPVDRVATWLHGLLVGTTRVSVVLVAILILLALFGIVGVAILSNPLIGGFVLLSIVPAFGIAAYVWRADVTRSEPLGKLLVTYILGLLFAGFAAVVNTIAAGYFDLVPVVGIVLYFFLVVGPVEEAVKWLAVRLYAYPSEEFDSVVDGAVYGAIAGLGFATIENAIYIVQQYLQASNAVGGDAAVGAVVGVAAIRTFAGPGHVLYSAFAGYYLGLAKFNPDHRGPIVVKGLLIAAGLHALYNTISTNLSVVTSLLGLDLPPTVAFFGFVLVFDGAIAYALFRKIRRYRNAYLETGADDVERERHAGDETAPD